MMLLLSFLLLIQSVFVHEATLAVGGSLIEPDDLGHLYVVQDRRIEKWSKEGKMLFQSGDLNFGEITSLDLSNPLMPFVYYREQAKVMILDNTLSQQGMMLDLFEKGFLQVEYVCGSRGDAFWLWDARMSELVRVDLQLQRLNSTGNLGVLLGLALHPVQVIERGNSVYLVDPDLGILQFDIYGTYRTRIPVRTAFPVRVTDDRLLFVEDGSLHILGRNFLEEDVIPLPDEDFNAFAFRRGKLYLTDSERTRVYRYSPDVKN